MLDADDRQSELAMVSRIRVEVRGGSMQAAERVAFTLLDHAKLAGYFEGIVPSSGAYTDHFFNYPQVTGKPGDDPDPWSELGMRYAGRLAFTFEPEVTDGGLKEFGFTVTHDGRTSESPPEDVSGKVIVLNRINPVKHESLFGEKAPPTMEITEQEADTETILDNIRRLICVDRVEVLMEIGEEDIPLWVVRAHFTTDDGRRPVAFGDVSLREAALLVLGECGVTIVHYDTEPARFKESRGVWHRETAPPLTRPEPPPPAPVN